MAVDGRNQHRLFLPVVKDLSRQSMPYYASSFFVPYSPEHVAALLRQRSVPVRTFRQWMREMSLPISTTEHLLRGSVNGLRFRLRLEGVASIARFRRSRVTMPLMRGSIVSADGGAIIHLTMLLQRQVVISLLLFGFFLGYNLAPMFQSGAGAYSTGWRIIWFFLAACLVVSVISFYPSAIRSRRLLHEQLAGHGVEQG